MLNLVFDVEHADCFKHRSIAAVYIDLYSILLRGLTFVTVDGWDASLHLIENVKTRFFKISDLTCRTLFQHRSSIIVYSAILSVNNMLQYSGYY